MFETTIEATLFADKKHFVKVEELIYLNFRDRPDFILKKVACLVMIFMKFMNNRIKGKI
jgi:hypothetical protein